VLFLHFLTSFLAWKKRRRGEAAGSKYGEGGEGGGGGSVGVCVILVKEGGEKGKMAVAAEWGMSKSWREGGGGGW